MSKATISFELKWLKSDGDCSPCFICEEPIYGKKVTLTIVAGEKKEETKVKMCESCYEMQS